MAEFSVDLPQPKATYVRLKRHLIPTVSPYISLLVSPIQRVFSQMGRPVPVVVYVVAMAAVIVSVDFVFFRNRFWERLIVNVGIVLVFVAFYLRFFRRP